MESICACRSQCCCGCWMWQQEWTISIGFLHTDLKPSNVLLKTAAKTMNDTTGCTAKVGLYLKPFQT